MLPSRYVPFALCLVLYAVLVMAHMPLEDGIWTNTLVQLAAILAIAALLYAIRRFSPRRRPVLSPVTRPLAA